MTTHTLSLALTISMVGCTPGLHDETSAPGTQSWAAANSPAYGSSRAPSGTDTADLEEGDGVPSETKAACWGTEWVPRSPEDATLALQKLFTKVADGECIRFDRDATYRLDLESDLLSLAGKRGVRVWGEGAFLELTNFDATQDLGAAKVITLTDTEDVMIADLGMGLDQPNHIMTTISDDLGNPGDGRFVVQVDDGYPVRTIGTSSDLYVQHLMHWQTEDVPGSWERFSGSILEVRRMDGTECPSGTCLLIDVSWGEDPPVGEKLLVMHDKRQAYGFSLTDAVRPVLKNLFFENLPGAAIYGLRVEALTVDGLHTYRPDNGQVSVNDTIWIRGGRGVFEITNVTASHQTDDVVNVHPARMEITDSYEGLWTCPDGKSSCQVYTRQDTPVSGRSSVALQSYAATGAEVAMFDENLILLGLFTYEGYVGGYHYFDASAPTDAAFVVAMDSVPSLLDLSDIHVSSGRTRILLKSPVTRLSRCSSTDNMMAGIYVYDEGAYPAESGVVADIRIKECSFRNVGIRDEAFPAAIVVGARAADGTLASEPVHGSVRISDSRFADQKQSAIIVHGAMSAEVVDNRFFNISTDPQPNNPYGQNGNDAGFYPVYFLHTDAIEMRGNTQDNDPGVLTGFGAGTTGG